MGVTSNCKPYARYDRLPAACCLLVCVTRPPPQKRIIPGSDSPPFVVAEALTNQDCRWFCPSIQLRLELWHEILSLYTERPHSEDGSRQYVNHVVEKEGQTINRLALGRQPSDRQQLRLLRKGKASSPCIDDGQRAGRAWNNTFGLPTMGLPFLFSS